MTSGSERTELSCKKFAADCKAEYITTKKYLYHATPSIIATSNNMTANTVTHGFFYRRNRNKIFLLYLSSSILYVIVMLAEMLLMLYHYSIYCLLQENDSQIHNVWKRPLRSSSYLLPLGLLPSLGITSRWLVNTPRNGDSNTSLSSLLQTLITHSA